MIFIPTFSLEGIRHSYLPKPGCVFFYSNVGNAPGSLITLLYPVTGPGFEFIEVTNSDSVCKPGLDRARSFES